jgi:hypothetical protein
VTVTRRIPNPLSTDEALDRVRDLKAWKVFAPGTEDLNDGQVIGGVTVRNPFIAVTATADQ